MQKGKGYRIERQQVTCLDPDLHPKITDPDVRPKALMLRTCMHSFSNTKLDFSYCESSMSSLVREPMKVDGSRM